MDRGENMLSLRAKKAVILTVLLLMIVASYAGASGKKVWEINVAKLGYRLDAKKTIVRWRGPYVVIGSSKFVPDEQNRQCVQAFDPEQLLLVFDLARGKQVSPGVLSSYQQEWDPPQAHKNFYPCADNTHYLPTSTNINDDLYYGHDYRASKFLVMDNTWKVKYRISPDFGCWGTCVVSSRSGRRFALLAQGKSLAAKIRNITVNLVHDPETDKKEVRVYSAPDGKPLFALSWVEPDHIRSFIDESERVAFSDDDEMLAVLDDEGILRIFRISDK
jgi:hypothetical protein